MSGTRKNMVAVFVALVVSMAMLGSVVAQLAGAAASTPAIDGAASTTPRAGTGTVAASGTGYDVCVPYWAKSVSHHFVLTKSGTEVDSRSITRCRPTRRPRTPRRRTASRLRSQRPTRAA